jgi:DNA-binding transcriptional LysR family regulator
MPTLRGLECFVAVLDYGSVTEAAARLHMSQPALSHQLAALEREIGAPVVERLPRGVRATPTGRAVAADARAALAAAESVIATGRAIAAGAGGRLRIACAASMTGSLLAPVLRTWRRRHPAVQLELDELTSADALADLVAAGRADLAIGPRPTTFDRQLDLIGEEQIVAVMAADSPFATSAGRAMTFAQLAELPVVHYHPENGLGGWLDGIAAGQGVTLNAVTRTRQTATAAQLAAAGLGIALVPTTALPATYSGVVRRLDPPVSRDIVTMVGAPSDPLVRRFGAEVRRRGIPVPKAIAAQLG